MTDFVAVRTGAVIRMRERLWRVDHVGDAGDFTATPLDGRDTTSRRFSPLLEDVTSNAMPFPDAAAIGRLPQQRQLLDAYRMSMIHGTAPIQGLQRSRAVPTEYQLVPLLKTLGKERVRLLIADDVGTGKTVEAGLVLSELMARGQVRRVLIAVPANLREQWVDALDHFFHIDSTIVAGHLLPALERRLLPGQSVWEAHDVVIASIDYLKKRPEHVFAHPWDLIVIDEAHIAARPHQINPSESDMQRWRFAERAAREAPHLMLLTATPHNGHLESYASLFELAEPSLVTTRNDETVIHRKQARDYVVQRRRSDVEQWYVDHDRTSPFPDVDQDEIVIAPGSYLKAMLAAIGDYSERLYEGQGSSHINGWIAAHLQKRALSSPEALRKSLKTRQATLRRNAALESTATAVRDAKEHVSDGLGGVDASDEERSTQVDVARFTLDNSAELDLLDATLEAAEKVTPARDTKLQRLFEILGGSSRAPGGRLAMHRDQQRVIVFTRFKDTLDYLVAQIRKEAAKKRPSSGMPANVEVFAIYGDMTQKQRRAEFARFERAAPAVLVATDCISEGLNLQRHCAEMIHYEVPYNPSRLSQRNGRISRYGQPEDSVGIRLLVLDDPLDVGLMEIVVRKAKAMYNQYGFVPDFLANPDILYHLSHDSNKRRLHQPTLFDSATDLAANMDADPFQPDYMDTIVEQSFYGQGDVSLGRVQEALDATRDAVGGADALTSFADLALGYYGLARHSDDEGRTFRITGHHPDLDDLLADNDRLYTFDPEVGLGDPDLDIVDLSHRLVRRLVDLTTERANLPDCAGRIAAIHTPDVETVTAVCHILARYVAQGTPPVLLEEVVPIALTVYGDTAPADSATELSQARPGQGSRTNTEVTEDSAALLARNDLTSRIETAVEQRRAEIAETHADLDAPWSQGLDNVEVASWDLTAITLYYPAPELA